MNPDEERVIESRFDLVGMPRRPLTPQEIANVLEMPSSTVSLILAEALQKIRKHIENDEGAFRECTEAMGIDNTYTVDDIPDAPHWIRKTRGDMEHRVKKRSMKCKDCDSPLMPTPTGSTCPNNCGRLYPPMNRKTQLINSALIAGLPKAKRLGDNKADIGDGKLYHIGKTVTSIKKKPGVTLAVFDYPKPEVRIITEVK